MKHNAIVNQLVAEAKNDPNILGFLVFGSVATGTQREDSDLDVLTVLETSKASYGIKHTAIDGIQVGNILFTYEVLASGVETVPYLLHPVATSKLLYDRQGSIQPLHERIIVYFTNHPEITDEWNGFRQLQKEEKAQYGHELTTIVDVWNELEKRHSGGRIRRPFFNAFYMTNPHIFSLLKRLM